jgi:hypothetical protein
MQRFPRLYSGHPIDNTMLDIRSLSRDNEDEGQSRLRGPKTMRHVSGRFQDIRQLASLLLKLCTDTGRFLVLCLWPAPALAAENLFLRRQLALYEERQVKPSRATNATRIVMVWLTYWLDWRPALRVVKPETLTRWHRQCVFH